MWRLEGGVGRDVVGDTIDMLSDAAIEILIERAERKDIPVLRLAYPNEFAFKADHIRQAEVKAWCEEHLVAYQGVPVGTIKQFIAGKGNADKAAVIAAIRSRGFNPADDNEADALAILLWATETQGGVR